MIFIKGCFKIMNLLKNFFVFSVSQAIITNGNWFNKIIHMKIFFHNTRTRQCPVRRLYHKWKIQKIKNRVQAQLITY